MEIELQGWLCGQKAGCLTVLSVDSHTNMWQHVCHLHTRGRRQVNPCLSKAAQLAESASFTSSEEYYLKN